jgi:SH3-like domain-containing protein
MVMKSAAWLLPAALAACAFAGSAAAAEFKSVGAAPALMYDAPSERGRKVFVAPRGMPVEIVLSYGEWVKVRDVAGDLSWVEARALDARRQLIVNVASAKVHAAADSASPVVFSADHGVLLELAEPIASGWIKVRHRDGQGGYVRASDVWGD